MFFRKAASASALAVIATLAFFDAAPASASASSRHPGAHRAHAKAARAGFVGVRYAPGHLRGRPSHFAALVGDPESGLGFYPLPWQYRIGAWRWRQRHAMQVANDIGFAIASTAVYSYPYWGGYGYGHHHGVFDPFDGVGTPFFGGYYRDY
ncbi:hypothetical protein RZS28_04250 [Methylocapsa polymorpha]|uniref:Transmembrane protein n=1 Tax=Methylocapsa polymorpha TaxID=3080828 RepID=A0ABZ0HUM2_9HYPH|nr:hypothetical protein RZS28_04250 [Methylocapsa sp. RX1]